MSAVNTLQGSGPMPVKPPTGAEQRAYEPSMEEILASIRRIIADDQSLPSRATPSDEATSGTHEGPASKGGEHPVQAPQETRAPQANQAPQPVTPYQPAQSADAFAGSPASVTLLHQAVQGRRTETFARPSGTDQEAPSSFDGGRDMSAKAHGAMHEHGPVVASPAGPATHPQDHAVRYDEVAPADAADDGMPDEQGSSALFSTATDQSVTGAFNTLAAMRLADNSDDLLGLAREMIRPLLRSWLDDNLPGMVERMVRAEIERVARGGR